LSKIGPPRESSKISEMTTSMKSIYIKELCTKLSIVISRINKIRKLLGSMKSQKSQKMVKKVTFSGSRGVQAKSAKCHKKCYFCALSAPEQQSWVAFYLFGPLFVTPGPFQSGPPDFQFRATKNWPERVF
jgi:hypothetical protein